MGELSTPAGVDTSSLCSDWQRPFLGIHAVEVFVRDQDLSLRFFTEMLEFSLALDCTLPSGVRWVAVGPPDGSVLLSLISPVPSSPEYALIGRRTGVIFLTENVITKFEEWRQRGVSFLSTPRLRRVRYERPGPVAAVPEVQKPIWGGVFTRFRDIDGNTFSLVGFDEANRELEEQRRLVFEKREAERRSAQELEIAKQVQARLFPQRLPPIETLEYAGSCVQARQVGGDYHDFLDLGRGRFGFVIADISGKGMPAALLMANLQANVRSQCAIALDEPERWLRSVNQLFFENTSESSYATLFFAEYDDMRRRLRYANCGHLAALLLRSDGVVDRLDSTGTVVGLFRNWDCEVTECQLSPGDTLVLYTDGITESFNAEEEEFGEERLIDAMRRHQGLAPHAAITAIVDEIQRFSPQEQHDDLTLIVAKCRAAASDRQLKLV